MILDQKYIHINSSPERVFRLIETMPNKFPIYKMLETKPIVFLRMLLTDGFSTACKGVNYNKKIDSLMLNIGDSMGPFRLTEVKRPSKYWFNVESCLINCRTGYSLSADENRTKLNLDITAEDLKFREKVYWFLVKPFHYIFAKKVLRIIKERAESM